MIGNRPNYRISSTTAIDKDYYINNMHYYIGAIVGLNDKQDTLDNINAANGIVSDETYKYVLKPLSGIKSNLPGEIRNTDFITPIREKNIGEYLELPHDFTVKVDDPDITLRRSAEVAKEIQPIIEQAIINKINESQDTGVPTQETPDIEKIVEVKIDEWLDNRAVNARHLVQSILDDNSFNNLILQLFNNWWSTEEVYIHLFIREGSLFIEPISPLIGYTYNNGEEFVEDHDAFLIKDRISLTRVEERYGDKLTDKDRDYLSTILNSFSDEGYSIPVDVYKDYNGRKSMDRLHINYQNDVLHISTNGDINEYILYYKVEVERKILLYYNQLGEEQERVLEDDEDFEFNAELGHIKINKEYIQETWQQVLLGNEYSGIYLKPEPLDVQIYNALGHNKLPIIGKKGILNSLYINPIPKRILPNLALHRIVTLQIERTIAKYKGAITLIPQSMMVGDGEMDTKANYFYMLADGTIIYDDSKVNTNDANAFRVVGNDVITNYIKALFEFRKDLKDEAWDMANMNDGRYGNAPSSSTVTNNQQNIFNAKLGSMLSVTTFNNILVKLYTMVLAYGEHLYPDGKAGSIFNQTDGSITYYNIDSGELTANKYGIHMTNSILDQQKLKSYKDLAFSAGQHGEFDLAMKAIDGDSVSELRLKINDYIKLKDDYEKQIKQQELEQVKTIHDEEMANDEANRAAKLNEIEVREEAITERELKLKGMENNSNTNNK